MIYSSLIFIYGFFPLSLLIHKLTPERYKESMLLILSLVFISFSGLGILTFIVLYAIVNYIAGLSADHLRSAGKRPVVPITAGIIADTVSLFFFRAHFLSDLRSLLNLKSTMLPLGISLLTLSAVGYLIDVGKGDQKAERDPVRFGLFMLMFPKMIMGPVLKYDSFKRILERRDQTLNYTGEGICLFVKGLTKKVLAADNLYMLYSAVKGVDVKDLSAVTAWMGALAYVLCLYFTLSGFADMGAGTAKCFGYIFPKSFRYPLFSSKLRYFAEKWHIQPVRWFDRYANKPLSRLTDHAWLKGLIFISVCGLLGFWYRFNANSLLSGLLFGTAMLIENKFRNRKLLKATGVTYTTIVLLVIGVIFSGSTMSYSMSFLGAMAGATHTLADSLTVYLLRSYLVLLLICIYASSDLFRTAMIRYGKTRIRTAITAMTPFIVLGMLMICTALMSYSGSSDMILTKL